MHKFKLSVDSYQASIVEPNSGGAGLVTLVPFGAQGAHVFVLFADSSDPFNGQIVGNGPNSYDFYVQIPKTTLFSGLLGILERSGPKFCLIEADSDIPPSGNFNIPIRVFAVRSGTLSATIERFQRPGLPESIRKLLGAHAPATVAGTESL